MTNEIAALVGSDGGFDQARTAQIIPKLRDAFDNLNTDFIKGCIATSDHDALDSDELTITDLGNLYAAALTINPLEELLNIEKNSPAGSIASSLGLTDLMRAAAPSGGGSESKADLFDPASDSAK